MFFLYVYIYIIIVYIQIHLFIDLYIYIDLCVQFLVAFDWWRVWVLQRSNQKKVEFTPNRGWKFPPFLVEFLVSPKKRPPIRREANEFYVIPPHLAAQGGDVVLLGIFGPMRWLTTSFWGDFWRWISRNRIPQQQRHDGSYLWTAFVWLRHVNNSGSLAPRRLGDEYKAQLAAETLQRTFDEATAIWETNVENGWGSTEPLLKPQPFTPKTAGDSETNVRNSFGNTPKNLLGGESHLRKNPERKRVTLPRNLYYGWRPQSYCCWGKKT